MTSALVPDRPQYRFTFSGTGSAQITLPAAPSGATLQVNAGPSVGDFPPGGSINLNGMIVWTRAVPPIQFIPPGGPMNVTVSAGFPPWSITFTQSKLFDVTPQRVSPGPPAIDGITRDLPGLPK